MDTWDIRGLDLHLPVSSTRPGRALEDGLRAAVADGRLPAGTRLPASRTLAADLGVARNTVGDVYARLAAEGWLRTLVGAGTWVAARARPTHPSSATAPPRPLLDLRAGISDASDFPRGAWASAARRTAADAPRHAFGYTAPAGDPVLRESLAGYLARTRGVTLTAADVFVGQGFGDLLSLVCRALRSRGARRIAVEEYGHERHRRIAAAAGLEVVPLPVDEDGADVSVLHRLEVGAVLLTPAHQFPTGVALSPGRRRAVVEWAVAGHGLVVEDDYDGEFRYDRHNIGALQGLAPDRVVYAGTASKALAPSVGLAWAAVPSDLMPALVEQRALTGVTPGGLHQRTLARFLDDHEYDRAVRRRRAVFRERRENLQRLLAQHAPSVRPWGMAAGLQCLVPLPDEAAEDRAVSGALGRGVRIEGLASFATPGPGPGHPQRAGVVVGYGAPAPAQAERALALAVEAVAAALRG